MTVSRLLKSCATPPELAHRFHPLGLAHRRLGFPALGDLLSHPLLQSFVETLEVLSGLLGLLACEKQLSLDRK